MGCTLNTLELPVRHERQQQPKQEQQQSNNSNNNSNNDDNDDNDITYNNVEYNDDRNAALIVAH